MKKVKMFDFKRSVVAKKYFCNLKLFLDVIEVFKFPFKEMSKIDTFLWRYSWKFVYWNSWNLIWIFFMLEMSRKVE